MRENERKENERENSRSVLCISDAENEGYLLKKLN